MDMVVNLLPVAENVSYMRTLALKIFLVLVLYHKALLSIPIVKKP